MRVRIQLLDIGEYHTLGEFIQSYGRDMQAMKEGLIFFIFCFKYIDACVFTI